jgi:hypothetical protein
MAQIRAREGGAELDVDEDSREVAGWVDDSFESNSFEMLRTNAQIARLRDGLGAVKVWGVDEHGEPGSKPFAGLRIGIKDRVNIHRIMDPDDAERIMGVIEYVPGAGQSRLWTTEEVVWIDDEFNETLQDGEHPTPGVIPFAFLGDGEVKVNDLVEYQKVLINMHSTRWTVERAQGFSIPVVHGARALENTETQLENGVKGVTVGALNAMIFEDPQGGLSFATPDAPLGDLRESYKMEMEEAMSLGGGLPAEVGTGGGNVAEKPVTAWFRWMKAFIRKQNMTWEAGQFMDSLFHVMAVYGERHGDDFELPSYSADDTDWENQFSKNPLPKEDLADRQHEAGEVRDNLRLAADYVAQHVKKDSTPEELMDYLEELKKGKAPPPMEFPDDEEEAAFNEVIADA